MVEAEIEANLLRNRGELTSIAVSMFVRSLLHSGRVVDQHQWTELFGLDRNRSFGQGKKQSKPHDYTVRTVLLAVDISGHRVCVGR